MKQTKKKISLNGYIKTIKKGSYEVKQELLGSGFQATVTYRVHYSKQTYSVRKAQRSRKIDYPFYTLKYSRG